jgi:hypothetical protein
VVVPVVRLGLLVVAGHPEAAPAAPAVLLEERVGPVELAAQEAVRPGGIERWLGKSPAVEYCRPEG